MPFTAPSSSGGYFPGGLPNVGAPLAGMPRKPAVFNPSGYSIMGQKPYSKITPFPGGLAGVGSMAKMDNQSNRVLTNHFVTAGVSFFVTPMSQFYIGEMLFVNSPVAGDEESSLGMTVHLDRIATLATLNRYLKTSAGRAAFGSNTSALPLQRAWRFAGITRNRKSTHATIVDATAVAVGGVITTYNAWEHTGVPLRVYDQLYLMWVHMVDAGGPLNGAPYWQIVPASDRSLLNAARSENPEHPYAHTVLDVISLFPHTADSTFVGDVRCIGSVNNVETSSVHKCTRSAEAADYVFGQSTDYRKDAANNLPRIAVHLKVHE